MSRKVCQLLAFSGVNTLGIIVIPCYYYTKDCAKPSVRANLDISTGYVVCTRSILMERSDAETHHRSDDPNRELIGCDLNGLYKRSSSLSLSHSSKPMPPSIFC